MVAHVVKTHEAKSRLSELLREVEAGHEVIVARSGRPVAKLIPWPPPQPERSAGSWAGRVTGDLDDVGSDDDIVAVFERSAEGEIVCGAARQPRGALVAHSARIPRRPDRRNDR